MTTNQNNFICVDSYGSRSTGKVNPFESESFDLTINSFLDDEVYKIGISKNLSSNQNLNQINFTVDQEENLSLKYYFTSTTLPELNIQGEIFSECHTDQDIIKVLKNIVSQKYMNPNDNNEYDIGLERTNCNQMRIKIKGKVKLSGKNEEFYIPLYEEEKDLYELNVYLLGYIKKIKNQMQHSIKKKLSKIDISKTNKIIEENKPSSKKLISKIDNRISIKKPLFPDNTCKLKLNPTTNTVIKLKRNNLNSFEMTNGDFLFNQKNKEDIPISKNIIKKENNNINNSNDNNKHKNNNIINNKKATNLRINLKNNIKVITNANPLKIKPITPILLNDNTQDLILVPTPISKNWVQKKLNETSFFKEKSNSKDKSRENRSRSRDKSREKDQLNSGSQISSKAQTYFTPDNDDINDRDNDDFEDSLNKDTELKSNILKSYKEIHFIKKFIGKFEKRDFKYKRIFSSSEDNDSKKTFHCLVDNKTPTITLIKTRNNVVFGGFTYIDFGFIGSKKDKYAFCFNVNNKKVYPIKRGRYAITRATSDILISFSDGEEEVIYIKAGFLRTPFGTCGKNHCPYYGMEKDYEINNGEEIYYIKELEVYQLVFQGN